MDILIHFVMFYFLLNAIIIIIAFKYDYSKVHVQEEGYIVLVKPLLKLVFAGVIFAIMMVIDELK